MKLCVVVGAVWLALLSFGVSAAETRRISIAGYLQQVSRENNIEVVGLSVVGGDTFTPLSRHTKVDDVIGRALARYNYIVNYSDQNVVKVVILGKRGNSVGALPEDEPQPPIAEDLTAQ